MGSYQQLSDHYRRLSHLEHIGAITSWDEAVMMPTGGGKARAEALATLAEMRHAMATDPGIEDLIGFAGKESLSDWERANLRIIQRRWLRENAVPASLVGARAKARMQSEQAWRTMRKDNDWAHFRPLLEEVVRLEREVAAAVGEAIGLSSYDALIDGFDPGLTQARIDPIFAKLMDFLPGFVDKAVEASNRRSLVVPTGPFLVPAQRELAAQVSRLLGFDMSRGRLDESHHPFCGGVPQDVRITTRYNENGFLSALMGVVHETGHACYEQGLPAEWLEQPVGLALGMALHESQSLLFEMQIGRSPAFLECLAPMVRKAFSDRAAEQPEAYTSANLRSLSHKVERSLIRVDADEATYPIHILLRYEIERDLFAGKIGVTDIPERWDTAMRDKLGLDTRGDFRNGCMQDVHWPAGLFGYFPSYTLGAMVAAQLMTGLRRDLADLDRSLERGELMKVRDWLRERVWSHGSQHTVDEILTAATGGPLNADSYIEHLQRRYLSEA